MTECIPKYPEHSKCSINIGNRKGGRERQRKVEGVGGKQAVVYVSAGRK